MLYQYEIQQRGKVKIATEVNESLSKKSVTKLYWINADTGEEIETITPGQKARLCFETQGYKKGKKVKAVVKWADGRKFRNNSTKLLFWGKIDENGKAVSKQVYVNSSDAKQ